jgi:hypothetical protein
VFSKDGSVTFETPSAPNQHAVTASGSKRFGKKLYTVAGVIAIAVIAVAFLIPQGAATLPLNVDYTVGEKMIYDMVENITSQRSDMATTEGKMALPPNTRTFYFMVTEEVVDFDGECYTLNHTVIAGIQGQNHSVSFMERMNKTGFSSNLLPEGTQAMVSNTSSNLIVSAVLARPEVKVGESWQVPFSTGNANTSMTGTLTLTFGDIQSITVPAGTYTVFRIDASGTDLVMNVNIPFANRMNVSTTVNMNQQMYIEYGTCKQIQSDVQSVVTVSHLDFGVNFISNISTQTILSQHIKP